MLFKFGTNEQGQPILTGEKDHENGGLVSTHPNHGVRLLRDVVVVAPLEPCHVAALEVGDFSVLKEIVHGPDDTGTYRFADGIAATASIDVAGCSGPVPFQVGYVQELAPAINPMPTFDINT